MKASMLAIAATLALSAGVQAERGYPEKPVRIIVGSAPGSATDVAVRLMAERLSAIWGHQALVDNRPGGGGSIAARAGQTATPDGYTLYVGAASTFIALKGAPGVAPNLPIELPRDFTAIGFITHQPMFIAVAPQLGVQSLPELIARAKSKPGQLSYATTGRGRITHLTMELLQERAGIKLQMIPYTGGPTAAMTDLGTGRVAIVIEGYSGLAGGITSGLIKSIAVASLERLADFQDPADRRGNAAWLRRRRLERAVGARRDAGCDYPENQRGSSQGSGGCGGKEEARPARRLSACDDT
jgi:tripartite-type tricarboxylate transporter receptor subunit TctC